MFNLIVGAVSGSLGAERLLEVVEDGLEYFVGTKGNPNFGQLMALSTLLLPEIGDLSSAQIAQVGRVEGLVRLARDYRFRFIPNTAIPPLSFEQLQALASRLHIGDWDLTRTRWSVKSSDLYQELLEGSLADMPSPTVFNLPRDRPSPGSIAVMMPFGAAFDPVWHTLKATAEEGGWICQRADNIWEDSVIINDIVTLIEVISTRSV